MFFSFFNDEEQDLIAKKIGSISPYVILSESYMISFLILSPGMSKSCLIMKILIVCFYSAVVAVIYLRVRLFSLHETK